MEPRQENSAPVQHDPRQVDSVHSAVTYEQLDNAKVQYEPQQLGSATVQYFDSVAPDGVVYYYKEEQTGAQTSEKNPVDTPRQRKRKASPWKYEPIHLRPCEVCGERATGFHFGVISCEACKSFYRRSLKRTKKYMCDKDNSCPTDTRGSTCAACRLQKCISVGMSPNAVKKGRYSYEKRAETIIQSRTYWFGEYEGTNQSNQQMQCQPEHSAQGAPHMYATGSHNVPTSYVQQLENSSTPIVYPQDISHNTTNEDMTPVVNYEEVSASVEPYSIAPSPQKSLREILGITNVQTNNISMHEMQQPAQTFVYDQGTWGDATNSDANTMQQFAHTTPGNMQVAPSPGAVSDDSGVYLMSPNQTAQNSSSSTNASIVPVSPCTNTVTTINEPQTKAEIVEVVPGKVRSINMRRELVIDGQSISYLLEGVLIAPETTPAAPSTSQRRPSADSHCSDDLTIDGQSIAAMLKDVLSQEDEPSTESLSDVISKISFASLENQSTINQVMIDGKPVGEMFDIFSGATNNLSHPPQIEHLQQPEIVMQSNVPDSTNMAAFVSVPPASSQNLESTSATLTQKTQETAQTLIHMATMPRDGAPHISVRPSTSEGSANNVHLLQQTSSKSSSSEQNSDKVFREELMSNNPAPDGVLKQLLKASTPDAKDLDMFIERVHTSVERNRILTPEQLSTLPALEKKFLEEREKKEQIFGKMGPISTDEYMSIYKETGIDVDGRSEIIQESMELIDPLMKKIISLYKSLPGFQLLPIDDQVSVLKGTKRHMCCFMDHQIYNCKEKLLTSPIFNRTYDMNYFLSFTDQETMEETFSLVERIQNLRLNDVETAVVATFVVMQPDACKTEEGRRMCEEQMEVNLRAFHRALCRGRTEKQALGVIQETLDILNRLKASEKKHNDMCNKFVKDYKHLDFPKLFTELYVE